MIGTDIIEIARIERAVQNPRFLTRVFTAGERDYWQRSGSRTETLAGLFCAKEAFAKAAGCGVRGFALTDVEVTHTPSGAPQLLLHGGAAAAADGKQPQLSIAHCREYATAVCLLTKQ